MLFFLSVFSRYRAKPRYLQTTKTMRYPRFNLLGSENTFSSFSRVFSEARRLPFPSVFGCWYGILSIYLSFSHNFKWDRWAAWQFRWSPSCALAFGCCGGATPVGLPFGSSSLIFISADVVSSIGLLYSFTDLSLCTCTVSFSFASIVAAFPILAFAGFFTSFR